MKKLLIGTMLASSLMFASSGTTEDFFYKSGYQAGEKAGFDKGVAMAFEEAKKILVAYTQEIKAYEIGKYLVKEKKITSPKIYQSIDSDGNMKILITKSFIEKEMNIDDIFEKFGEIPQMKESSVFAEDTKSLDEVNSVNISSRDSITNLPSKADKNDNIIVVSVEKNGDNEDILKSANVVYTLDEDRYRIMFFTKTEKENFCNSFKICR